MQLIQVSTLVEYVYIQNKIAEDPGSITGSGRSRGEGKGYNSSCRFTAWKNIFQNYELTAQNSFFHTYELYNEGLQCILRNFHFFKIAAF